jgi:tRNA U54 and U55 pseudouridine synthase Pus10
MIFYSFGGDIHILNKIANELGYNPNKNISELIIESESFENADRIFSYMTGMNSDDEHECGCCGAKFYDMEYTFDEYFTALEEGEIISHFLVNYGDIVVPDSFVIPSATFAYE